MLSLPNIICLLTAAATVAAKGSVDPCSNGVYTYPGAFRSAQIHCNTTLAPYNHRAYNTIHYTKNSFKTCAAYCFGQYTGSECCAAGYDPATKKCVLLFAYVSVCTAKGGQFVGPSDDSMEIAVITN